MSSGPPIPRVNFLLGIYSGNDLVGAFALGALGVRLVTSFPRHRGPNETVRVASWRMRRHSGRSGSAQGRGPGRGAGDKAGAGARGCPVSLSRMSTFSRVVEH